MTTYLPLLKGRLTNQITSFKETVAKKTLFREKGIIISSILSAIGMAIGVLVEALLPGGEGRGGKPPLKDGGGGGQKNGSETN